MPKPEKTSLDLVIDVYKRDVDVTLIRENLRLTPYERIQKLMAALRGIEALRTAARASRVRESDPHGDDD